MLAIVMMVIFSLLTWFFTLHLAFIFGRRKERQLKRPNVIQQIDNYVNVEDLLKLISAEEEVEIRSISLYIGKDEIAFGISKFDANESMDAGRGRAHAKGYKDMSLEKYLKELKKDIENERKKLEDKAEKIELITLD